MFLNFMAEDVEVSINLDHVRSLECIGDHLIVGWDNVTKEYEYVVAMHYTQQPNISYPDETLRASLNNPDPPSGCN
jgi:hypothetical protein